jgi:Haem-binding domain
MKRRTRNLIIGASTVIVAFGLIQLVPYRVSNPPVTGEPKWDSPQTRALVVAACYDCHSNQTKTPWYGTVAPISWWLTNHVDDGRKALNFSEWNRPQSGKALRAARAVQRGSMPPSYYTWFGLHSNAKLTSAQRAALVAGLTKTLGLSPPLSTTSG